MIIDRGTTHLSEQDINDDLILDGLDPSSGQIIGGVEFSDSFKRAPFVWNVKRNRILTLKLMGKTQQEIARDIPCSAGVVSAICRRPEFKQAMEEALEDSRQATIIYLQQHALEAACTQVDLMRNSDSKNKDDVRFQVTKDILDRVGIRVGSDNHESTTMQTGSQVINVNVLNATEDAFAAALRKQPLHLGDNVRQGDPSDQGNHPLRTLSLPGGFSEGQVASETDLQVSAGGSEPGGSA